MNQVKTFLAAFFLLMLALPHQALAQNANVIPQLTVSGQLQRWTGMTLGGKNAATVALVDASGNQITGFATAANQTTLNGYVDGIEALITSTNGYVDGIETLIGSTNTKLDTLDGRVDTLETLIASTNTKLDTMNTNISTGSIPAGTAYIGKTRTTDGTRDAVVHPCAAAIQTYAPISITTATTTRIVAPSASNKTYICSMFLTSAAADNVGIVEGTGGTCGTGTAGVIGGTTAANGPNFAANGGVMLQTGGRTSVAQTAGTNVDLCLITSAATPLAGGINYVQAP